MTKQQRLEAQIEAKGLEGELFISFRGRSGWFLESSEPRWFGDDGEFLGNDFEDALVSLSAILADQQINRHAAVKNLRGQLFQMATKRIRDEQLKVRLQAVLKKMAFEEVSYWHAKCEMPNGARAFRILFGGGE